MSRLKPRIFRKPFRQNDEQDDAVISDINTTPLIDVMLVLLVMLIITIPLQTQSVQLAIAQGNPPENQTPPPFVTVGVDFDNTLTFNNQVVANEDALATHLKDIAGQVDQPELHIKPDPMANYETVAIILADAQRLGVKKIGIINKN